VRWDTATDRLPDDEVLFLFGHESGHYVLNHLPKGMVCSAVGTFFVFWISAGIACGLARRYGVRWQLYSLESSAPLASRQGFLVLLFALSVVGLVLQPVGNAYSRSIEHEADVYGQEAIHGLVADPQKTAVSAFNHLGEAWLEDPNPSPFVEFWEYSHPVCNIARSLRCTTIRGRMEGGDGSLHGRDQGMRDYRSGPAIVLRYPIHSAKNAEWMGAKGGWLLLPVLQPQVAAHPIQ
jgi:hypothetical protein